MKCERAEPERGRYDRAPRDATSRVPGSFPGQGAAAPYDADYRPKPAYGAIAAVPADGGTYPAGTADGRSRSGQDRAGPTRTGKVSTATVSSSRQRPSARSKRCLSSGEAT